MKPSSENLSEAKRLAATAKRARALLKLSHAQRELGAFDAALGPAREAVDLFRSLMSSRADVFQPELAEALESWWRIQSDLGRHDTALVGAMEVMDSYRGLAKAHPEKYLPRFAMALNGLSTCLRHLGRHEEALPLAQNALEWLWPYYERFPDVHQKHVETMFSVLGVLHEDLGTKLDASWARKLEEVAARTVKVARKDLSSASLGVGKKKAPGKKKKN